MRKIYEELKISIVSLQLTDLLTGSQENVNKEEGKDPYIYDIY